VSTVRTQLLGTAPALDAVSTLFEVPDGLVYVVTCATMCWGNTEVSGLDIWFMRDDLTKLMRVFQASEITGSNPGFQTPLVRWVFEPGQQLLAQADVGTADFSANGYILTLP
jgi:hypothetical protein